jgi:tetratricopeptide (TPR) repeat protein
MPVDHKSLLILFDDAPRSIACERHPKDEAVGVCCDCQRPGCFACLAPDERVIRCFSCSGRTAQQQHWIARLACSPIGISVLVVLLLSIPTIIFPDDPDASDHSPDWQFAVKHLTKSRRLRARAEVLDPAASRAAIDRAAAFIESFIEVYPDESTRPFARSRALCALAECRPEKAKEIYRQVADDYPTEPTALFARLQFVRSEEQMRALLLDTAGWTDETREFGHLIEHTKQELKRMMVIAEATGPLPDVFAIQAELCYRLAAAHARRGESREALDYLDRILNPLKKPGHRSPDEWATKARGLMSEIKGGG